MKSRVIKCFDYTALGAEPEAGRWKIADSEIKAELEALARDYSGTEKTDDAVQAGDCVYCVCQKASKESWQGRTVLLYPGRKLPGAEEAEQVVLGKKAGEEFASRIKDVELYLRIKEVVHIREMKVCDALAAKLGLPGVKTVKDYYRWYHEQHDEERREKACIAISRGWLEEIAKRSEIYVDSEELEAWGSSRARLMYDAMLAAGYDMRKTPEGEILTEEEALARAAESQKVYFVPYLIYSYFCEQAGYEITEEDFKAEIVRMAAERGETPEELMKQADISMFRERKYQEYTYYNVLNKEAEKYLEV